MGPKRIGLVKEPSVQVDTPKKKTPVSVASTKSLSDKNRDSSSVTKRRAISSSVKVTSHQNLTNTHNPMVASASQYKKINKPDSIIHSKSTPRNLSRTTNGENNGVNSNKRTVVKAVSKLSTVNIQRDRSQNVVTKDASGTLGKTFGKNKTGQKPSDARTSITTSLHPVALIKDESKIFKEKNQNKIKSTTASSKTSTSTINIEKTSATLRNDTEKLTFNNKNNIKDEPFLDGINNFGPDSLKKTTENDIRMRYENEHLSKESHGDYVKTNDIEDSSYYHSIINCGENYMDKGDGYNATCKLNTELSETIADSEFLSPAIKTEFIQADSVTSTNFNNVNDSKNNKDNLVNQSDIDSSFFVISDNKHIKTSYLPSFYLDSLDSEKLRNENNEGENVNTLIHNQSSDITLMKNDIYDEMLEPKASCITINLEDPNISLLEMKPCQSLTTIKSSYDGKTFIIEEPIVIRNFTQNYSEIDNGNNRKSKVETELPLVEKEELSLSASVKSVLQVNEPVKLNDNFDPSPAKPVIANVQATSEKDIRERNEDEPDLEVKSNKEDNLVENDISDVETFQTEHAFDSVDTLEVLNLDELSKDNYTVDLSNIVIRNLFNTQEFPKTNVQLLDENDEFDMESEEVLHTVDISNCVWMDCKIQLNKPKPDGSEVWVFDEEDTIEDNINTSDLVLIDSEEQDWIVTERNLHELKTCLDECEQEAKNASRELNRLTIKHQSVTKGKLSYPRNVHNKSSKKMNKIKEINVDDINIVNVSESVSNQEFNIPSCNNYMTNSSVKEDDIDYFSVSSGDEVNDFEEDKIPEAKPQKSYLSFGKSCVKLKKKNEKKIFLSFFNLFK